MKCTKCGFENEHKVGFCDKCGVRLPKVVKIEPKVKTLNQSKRTILLTIVLVINYLFAGLLTLLGLFTLIVGVLAIVGNPSEGYNPLVLVLLVGVTLGIAILTFWMTYSLQQYNNRARIVMIIYFVINLLLSIFILYYLGIILSGFIIYVIAFDKNTLKPFKEL